MNFRKVYCLHRASQLPCLRFVIAVFAHRNCRVCASQLPCLRFVIAVFAHRKWRVYNFQVMAFGLTNMLCKRFKNVKIGAFLPCFCINIQNDRKIANKVLFFHIV